MLVQRTCQSYATHKHWLQLPSSFVANHNSVGKQDVAGSSQQHSIADFGTSAVDRVVVGLTRSSPSACTANLGKVRVLGSLERCKAAGLDAEERYC